MLTKKRKVLVGAIIVGVLLVFAIRHIRHSGVLHAISSRGGTLLEVEHDSSGVFYLQRDERWASESLGACGDKMARVGCTICSVAMASTELGYRVTPKELNLRLKDNEGYTRSCWLIWAKVEEATRGAIHVDVIPTPSHTQLDECLQSGSIPVVKFFLPHGVPHWVAVVGKSGVEYLIKDPLDASKKIRQLSAKTQTIVSMRCVRKL